MFSLICARINGWVNNREAGDLRRHQAHCDVIVMESIWWVPNLFDYYMCCGWIRRMNVNTHWAILISIPCKYPLRNNDFKRLPPFVVFLSLHLSYVMSVKEYSFPADSKYGFSYVQTRHNRTIVISLRACPLGYFFENVILILQNVDEPLHLTKYVYRHYSDVIMGAVASRIIGVSIVYSTACSGADQRHQSSVSLASVRGIHRLPVTGEFSAQRLVTREMFPLDDVIIVRFLGCFLVGWYTLVYLYFSGHT